MQESGGLDLWTNHPVPSRPVGFVSASVDSSVGIPAELAQGCQNFVLVPHAEDSARLPPAVLFREAVSSVPLPKSARCEAASPPSLSSFIVTFRQA